MFKNIAIADPYNLANTATAGMDVSSVLPSSNYITALGQFNYCDFKCDDVSIEHIVADIPTIFTIISTKIIDSKLINIKYKEVDPRLNSLNNYGNIYISSGIFGIYNSSDNFYWRNEAIIEVESEEYIDKIQPGMKFTNVIQWEKKLTIEEVINMINDPFEYYKYIHKIVEQHVHDKPRSVCIEKHREIDKLYDLDQ